MRDTTTRQTILQARRLHSQAINSYRQADIYDRIADQLQAFYEKAETPLERDIYSQERNRQIANRDEMMEDHDELMGQIEPELIDHL